MVPAVGSGRYVGRDVSRTTCSTLKCPEGLSGDIYAHHSEFSSQIDGDNEGGTAGHYPSFFLLTQVIQRCHVGQAESRQNS